MSGTVELPGARKLTTVEESNKAHLEAVNRILQGRGSKEEKSRLFDDYVAMCLENGTLFEETPSQYNKPGIVYKPYDVNDLRRYFNNGLAKSSPVEPGGGDKWREALVAAVKEKNNIVNAIQSGNGSYAEARLDRVRELLDEAERELERAYFDVGQSEGVPVKSWKRNVKQDDKNTYAQSLKMIQAERDKLDSDMASAFSGRGVVGVQDAYDADGNAIGQTSVTVDKNAGYERPARVLREGGYLTKGITKDAAKKMLEQASQSVYTGGYAYLAHIRNSAAILASDRYKKSGIELFGLSPADVWRCARNTMQAANELLDVLLKDNTAGRGITGASKMAASDRDFVNRLSELKVSVNDLMRPMGDKEDIFEDRAIDDVNYGQAMFEAGKMYYSKLGAGARLFGNMDYSMKAGDHASVLYNWVRMNPALIRDAGQRSQFEELKRSVEYYKGIYENLRGMLTSLFDQGDVRAGFALAKYYNQKPSWEPPSVSAKWNNIYVTKTTDVQEKAAKDAAYKAGSWGYNAYPEDYFGEGTLGNGIINGIYEGR